MVPVASFLVTCDAHRRDHVVTMDFIYLMFDEKKLSPNRQRMVVVRHRGIHQSPTWVSADTALSMERVSVISP